MTCRSPSRRDAGEAAAPAGDAGDGRPRARPRAACAPRSRDEGTVKSADRVLTVLDHLATARAATFSGITSALGLPNSSAHDLLQTMVRRGYLEYDPQGRTYGLGLRLWQVAQAYAGHRDLVAVARPVMEELVAVTGETVQLARLDGVENVYLAIAESPHPMKLVSAVGARLFAHATGLGKVLLAALEPAEARERLAAQPLPRFTPYTVTDVDALMERLAVVRDRGYATDDEEYVVGCRCIAMPVFDAFGEVVAAMSVSIPTPRYGPEVAVRAMDALRDGVTRLSTRLGHAPESRQAEG